MRDLNAKLKKHSDILLVKALIFVAAKKARGKTIFQDSRCKPDQSQVKKV